MSHETNVFWAQSSGLGLPGEWSKCNLLSVCLGSQDPISLGSFTMAGLVPDLQHILFWMSNSVELLYFIQQKCPLYMQSLEDDLDVTGTVGWARCHLAITGSSWPWATSGAHLRGSGAGGLASLVPHAWHRPSPSRHFTHSAQVSCVLLGEAGDSQALAGRMQCIGCTPMPLTQAPLFHKGGSVQPGTIRGCGSDVGRVHVRARTLQWEVLQHSEAGWAVQEGFTKRVAFGGALRPGWGFQPVCV